MINYRELKTLSLEFRRVSSNLLNSNRENCNANLIRFKKFIDETPFIKQLLNDTIDGIDYDFKECFLIENGGWHSILVPADETLHIKAQYDYITFIIESNGCNLLGQAMGFPHSSNKITDIIQSFISKSFKPLIDYINDAISKEIMLLEEEQKRVPSMVQQIGNLYGSAVQGSAVTSTNTTIINDNDKLLEMLGQAIKALSSVEAPEEVKADLKDDLEIVSEQVVSPTPKRNRLSKALAGIKKFVSEFIMKLSVTAAAGAVMGFDWNALIQDIQKFIDKIV